jgi:hypothetical protein
MNMKLGNTTAVSGHTKGAQRLIQQQGKRIARCISVKVAFVACAVAYILFPAGAHAATVTVVHGINGGDLGLARNLPVDIAVNGSCALKGLIFTQSTRVQLGAGSYSVTVHPSNGACSTAPVIKQSVTVPATARSIGLVANLSNFGTPQLAAFINDNAFTSAITVNNAAANARIVAGAGPGRLIFYYGNSLSNGAGIMLLADPSTPRITVKLYRENARRALFSERVRLTSQRVYYVVGSLKSGLRVVTDASNS